MKILKKKVMMMRLAGLPVLASAMAPVVALALAVDAAQPAFAADKFQFMKATENRVWRLNRETGAIAVCTLKGKQLVCATSSGAVTPRGDVEYQAQRQTNHDEEKAARARQEERDMKILTRVFDFFKEMIAMSREGTGPSSRRL